MDEPLPASQNGNHRHAVPAAWPLDAFNAFAADMRDGVGPYLALFLVGRSGWSPSRIGWALAAASIATLLCTTPAGWILDASKRKSRFLIAASIAIAILTAVLAFANGFWPVIGLQIATGVASAFIGPGIAVVSLVSFGESKLAKRIGRNETFNHGGNFCAAMIAAWLVQVSTIQAVFALVILMSSLSATCGFFLDKKARHATIASPPQVSIRPKDEKKSSWRDLTRDGNLLFLLAIAFLFQFANASLLPLAAQALAHPETHMDTLIGAQTAARASSRFLSWGIVVAQLVAIPAAYLSGWTAKKITATKCLIIGIGAVAIRALIFSTVRDVDLLIAAQVFDGIAAGVIAVAPLVAISEINGTQNRFSFISGLLATAISLGASCSNIMGGYLAQALGSSKCFSVMASIAGFAVLLLLFKTTTQIARSRLAPLVDLKLSPPRRARGGIP